MNELMIKKFRESCDYNIVLIGFMELENRRWQELWENGLTWRLWKWMNSSRIVRG